MPLNYGKPYVPPNTDDLDGNVVKPYKFEPFDFVKSESIQSNNFMDRVMDITGHSNGQTFSQKKANRYERVDYEGLIESQRNETATNMADTTLSARTDSTTDYDEVLNSNYIRTARSHAKAQMNQRNMQEQLRNLMG